MARTRRHGSRKHSRKHNKKHGGKKGGLGCTKRRTSKKGGMDSSMVMPHSELYSKRTGSLSARRASRAAIMKDARAVQEKLHAIGKAHEAALAGKREDRSRKHGGNPKKGQKSKTMKGRKDFTTKKTSKFFNRKGHRQTHAQGSKKHRRPFAKRGGVSYVGVYSNVTKNL